MVTLLTMPIRSVNWRLMKHWEAKKVVIGPRRYEDLLLRRDQQGLLDRLRQIQENEAGCGIEVILARLVNHPQLAGSGRCILRQTLIQLVGFEIVRAVV